MERHQFTDEDRDALIGQKTTERVRSWCLLLAAGDKRATNDLHNLVLDRLTDESAKELFVKAATDPDCVGSLFADLVAKAIFDRCAKDAEQDADSAEKGREQSRDDDRIAMAELATMLH